MEEERKRRIYLQRQRELNEKREKEKKIKKANIELENESNELISIEKENFKKKLINDKNLFNKIENYIKINDNNNKNYIYYNKNNMNIISNNIDKIYKKLISKNELNILVIGETGSGKSTLINSFLQLPPQKQAETHSSKPCTMEPRFYSSENPYLKNINLIDSRGFEKDEGYSIKNMEKDIINYIKKQRLSLKPIHFIWYCFKGSRFEDSEENLVQNLRKLNIPVLLVYTMAINEELINFDDLKKKGFDSVQIIAKDIKRRRNVFKSFGLNELMKKTNEINNKTYYSLLKKISFVRLFHEVIKKANNYEINYIDENNFVSNLENILNYIFDGYEIEDEYLDNIQIFINQIKNIVNKFIFSFIEKNNTQLIDKLIDLQQKINIRNDGCLLNMKVRNTWRIIINNKIKRNLSDEIFKKIIIKIFRHSLNNYIIKLYEFCKKYY